MKVHILLGAPGSGKGTQAKQLVDKFALTHLSTGDILRDAVSKGTEVGLRAAAYMANGKLVDDNTVNGLVFARLQGGTRDVLFDGYPRTLNQAIALDDFLSSNGIELGLVVNIDVPRAALESRVVGRRVCSNGACGAIYHLSRKPSLRDGICDLCGHGLIQRQDDTVEAFRSRMDQFDETFVPLLEHCRRYGGYFQVDGQGYPEDVFRAVVKLFEENA